MTKYVPMSAAMIVAAEMLFEEVVVPIMAEEHKVLDGELRNGAYLGIRDMNNEEMVRKRAGRVAEENFASYSINIDGKNKSLAFDLKLDASWEVHQGDLSKKPYPGAIRTDHDDRIAISGFSWQRDTVGSLWIARKLERITLHNASRIAKLCGIFEDYKRLVPKLNAVEKELRLAA